MKRALPLVHRWALVRTGDPAEADDLTQDVLVQVIRKLDSFEGSSRFTTWLYTVTRNAAADRFRRTGRREEVTGQLAASERLESTASPDPEEAIAERKLADLVLSFFRELPERQRQVFDLTELQGVPAKDVAERLGIDPVSVRVSLMKARRTLRRRILESHPELAEDVT